MTANQATQLADERIERWVREHAGAVRGYLLGLVRRADAADDLLQEVFRRAWQARDRYRDEGRERAYLLRIADRLVVDRSRRLGLEVNVDEATWQEVEPAADETATIDRIVNGDLNAELLSALAQLTNVQKRVLLLRFFSDMTFEEIAEALGCPLGTALSHCRRGLAAMRKLMTVRS